MGTYINKSVSKNAGEHANKNANNNANKNVNNNMGKDMNKNTNTQICSDKRMSRMSIHERNTSIRRQTYGLVDKCKHAPYSAYSGSGWYPKGARLRLLVAP